MPDIRDSRIFSAMYEVGMVENSGEIAHIAANDLKTARVESDARAIEAELRSKLAPLRALFNDGQGLMQGLIVASALPADKFSAMLGKIDALNEHFTENHQKQQHEHKPWDNTRKCHYCGGTHENHDEWKACKLAHKATEAAKEAATNNGESES